MLKGSGLQALDEVLMGLLQKGKSPLSDSFMMSKIWAQWRGWFAQSITNNTEPLALKNGILYVWVKSASWRYELNFNKPYFLAKVQEETSTQVIKDIIFTWNPKELPLDVLEMSKMKNYILGLEEINKK